LLSASSEAAVTAAGAAHPTAALLTFLNRGLPRLLSRPRMSRSPWYCEKDFRGTLTR